MTDEPGPAHTSDPVRRAAGVGLATYDAAGRILDVLYPSPVLDAEPPVPDGLADLANVDALRGTRTEVVVTRIALNEAPDLTLYEMTPPEGVPVIEVDAQGAAR